MDEGPRVEITYCRQCRWLLRATWTAQELLTTFDGELGTGSGAPESVTGEGTYSVDANAFVTLSNPITNTLEINGRLGANNEVLLGASTEAPDGSYDLFVAIRSPASGVSNGTLGGAYTGATLMFPDGAEAGLKPGFPFWP